MERLVMVLAMFLFMALVAAIGGFTVSVWFVAGFSLFTVYVAFPVMGRLMDWWERAR
jgi:hypothetical protein